MKNLKIGIITFILTILVSGTALACYKPVDNPPQECEVDCVTPTPTLEPDFTPTPTSGESAGMKGDDRGDYHQSAVEAPKAPQCNIPFEKARVWYTKVNGKVVFNWATDAQDIQKFSIVYGYKEDKLEFGVDDIPSNVRSLEIKGLTKSPVYFQVWSWSHDCAEKSVVIDP